MDTWIVVALVAWTGVALLAALLVGRALTRSEREERAARAARDPAARRGPVPAPVVVPLLAEARGGTGDDSHRVFHYRQRSAS